MSRNFGFLTTLVASVAIIGSAVDRAHAVYTGPTTGTATYTDIANWGGGGGPIDDVIDGTTVLTGNLTLEFGSNRGPVGPVSWGPNASGSDFDLLLIGNGTARTFFLSGNVSASGGNDLDVTVGGAAGAALTLDLANTSRNFSVGSGGDSLTIVNPFDNAIAGFSKNGLGRLILESSNSGIVSGTVSVDGSVELQHELAVGDATYVFADDGLTILSLGANFTFANDVVSNDTNGNGNRAGFVTSDNGTFTGTVTVSTDADFSTGNSGDITFSNDVTVNAGGQFRVQGDNNIAILTSDTNLLAGQMFAQNSSDTVQLGTGGDAAFMTIDINDNTGEFGRFTGDGQLAIVNAVLDLDTTDVTGMSQSWVLVAAGVSNGSTYSGLTDLRLDGVSFVDGGTTWTASNGLGNWTFTEGAAGEDGILELEFILVAPTPEPSAFLLMTLAALGLCCVRHRRARWLT